VRQGRKEAVTFFEKKVTKKTFGPLRAGFGPHAVQTPREAVQKFFARFFSKKRFFLSRALFLALLAALTASPCLAQSPDPNAIDTGNFTAPPSPGQQQTLAHDLAELGWIFGPETIPIGATATIAIPSGYEMLTPPDAQRFLQLNGNTLSAADANDYILQNEDPDSGWFAVICPESGGHVADADPLDPSAILATMQNTAAQDKTSQTTSVAWAVPPAYDQPSHRLEWAFAFTSTAGAKTVPLNIRFLGRTGDMKITVSDDPSVAVNDLADVNKPLAGLTFNQSQQYTDYAQGDATAPYGLAGLIEGASAATNTLPPPAPPARNTGEHIAIVVALVLLAWLALKRRGKQLLFLKKK